MAEQINQTNQEFQEVVLKINRCATVVKGGRRFSFAALVVIGNGTGTVGWGYGKAREVPVAIEKAIRAAKKQLVRVSIVGKTIPHEVKGIFGAAKVVILPAAPGTGLIAGTVVRSVLRSAGVENVLTKSFGTNNPINLVKATFDAISQLRTREEVASLRGVQL